MSITRRRETRYTARPSTTTANPIGPIPDVILSQSLLAGASGISDAASSDTGNEGVVAEEYRQIKCSFSVTIRRDASVVRIQVESNSAHDVSAGVYRWPSWDNGL